MMHRILLSALCLSFPSIAAYAQDLNPLVRERITVAQQERRDEPVRVQVGINLFMPGPTGDGEEAAKLRERARRAVYAMALRECDVVLDVLAKECRLENINVNVNRQAGANMGEGYQVNGTLGLRIVLK